MAKTGHKWRSGALRVRSERADQKALIERKDEPGHEAAPLTDRYEPLSRRLAEDPLTGLSNRTALSERLALLRSERDGSESRNESLVFVDIDDFAGINNTLGSDGGDALLIQMAKRLTCCVRPGDMVARLGGDKFAIVVVEDYGRASAVEVADRVLAVLRTPFLVKGVRLAVSVSIGVAAQGDEDHSGAAELLAQAALATRLAKRGGRGRYQIFDAQSYDVRAASGTASTSR